MKARIWVDSKLIRRLKACAGDPIFNDASELEVIPMTITPSSIIAAPLAVDQQMKHPSAMRFLTPLVLKTQPFAGITRHETRWAKWGAKQTRLSAPTKSASASIGIGRFCVALIVIAVVLVLPVAVQAQSSKAKGAKGADRATAALRNRVQQLEGQVLDMQVIIGTLQSLARSGGGGGGAAISGPALNSGSGGSGGGTRVRILETQIQALTTQVERLSRQMRGDRRGDAGSYVPSTGRVAGVTSEDLSAPIGAGETGGGFRTSAMPGAISGDVISGFGATTVTPGGGGLAGADTGRIGAGGDAIGRMLDAERSGDAAGTTRRDMRIARARSAGDPKQLYETAYGYLLQQNYRSAQSAFREFLDLFPDDPLAGNAQYWLGETFYVRRKYRSAANAFLKGYQKYSRSNKAPDNLLKLSMSLERLGQKEAACSSFLELQEKFPRAPAHVKKKTKKEIRRLKC